MITQAEIQAFVNAQLDAWPLAATNHAAVESVLTRRIKMPHGHPEVTAQYNPARALSTGAKVDTTTIDRRPCFLCRSNRPACQQAFSHPDVPGGWEILVNPYPVFPGHLTIASITHTPQDASSPGVLETIAQLAVMLEGYAVFFNGARCGASAPDHLHLQAVPSRYLPWLGTSSQWPFETLTFQGSPSQVANTTLNSLFGDYNLVCHATATAQIRMIVIPRRAHRPDFYGPAGDPPERMMISPASIDLCGVLITPRHEDFLALDADIIQRIWGQVCFTTLRS